MLESTTLYRQLAHQIREMIRAGTLRAGERVPSVRRLSRQQGVSISTVLQAYGQLEDSGIIEARPQSGFYVQRLPSLVREPDSSRPPRRALRVEINALAEAVLAHAADPKVIAFGSACPEGGLFPLERISRVIAALGRYGLPPGTEKLRRAVARRVLDWGCQLDHSNLVTTSGCMEAINLCLLAVTKPGDLVALESPTYYGFPPILESLGLRALEIPTHPRSGHRPDCPCRYDERRYPAPACGYRRRPGVPPGKRRVNLPRYGVPHHFAATGVKDRCEVGKTRRDADECDVCHPHQVGLGGTTLRYKFGNTGRS